MLSGIHLYLTPAFIIFRVLDCDGYRPDTIGGGTGQAESVTSNHPGRRQLLLRIILLTHLKAGFKRGLLPV